MPTIPPAPGLSRPLLVRAARDRYRRLGFGAGAIHIEATVAHRDVVAVEQVFFQVNVRTAMSVGQASGLALAEAAAFGCEVVQYTPNQVKNSVAGYGGADKAQVQRMVQVRLGFLAPPKPADAADAAALALCHLSSAPLRRHIEAISGATLPRVAAR